jgi:hypothetical protein
MPQSKVIEAMLQNHENARLCRINPAAKKIGGPKATGVRGDVIS